MTKLSVQAGGVDKKPLKDDAYVVNVDQQATQPVTTRSTQRRARKQATCLHILALFFILSSIALAIVGSYYMYQAFKPTNYSKNLKFVLPSGNAEALGSTNFPRHLDEHVEESEGDNRETIQVPKFDDGDEATFIHDFRQSISVIKDITDGLCYILPLDRQLIPQPSDLLQFLRGIVTNEYVLDADMIQSDYEVVQPAIGADDVLSLYGSYISDACGSYQTYRLRLITQEDITTTTALPFMVQRKFILYPGGQVMVSYVIYK